MDSSFWFDKDKLGMVNSTSKSHISKINLFFSQRIVFVLVNRVDPDEMLCYVFTVCQSTP